jgi:hypothetical protein
MAAERPFQFGARQRGSGGAGRRFIRAAELDYGHSAGRPTTESVAPAETSFRALPPWANPTDTRTTNTSAGMPVTGQINNAASRRGGNTVFRMRDRRYRMPLPTLGG